MIPRRGRTRPGRRATTPARAARVSSPRRRRRAARRSSAVLAARLRAPAAVLVVRALAAALAARRRALVAARAAAARAARRWAGSGAASTSWTTRRYCYSAQYHTRHSTRRCRRSGRCPARRPAATASRWSRPPTRAACTSGRRRGAPWLLICAWAAPLLGCPIRKYRSQGCVLWQPLDSWRHGSCAERRMAHMSALGACFYAQSASVTSRSSADRAGRLQPAGATFPCARIMDCGESSSFAKTLECHSRMPSLSKSSARGGKNDLVQFRG